MRNLFLILIMVGMYSLVVAQKSPKKFGEIELSDLEMTIYNKDTNAAAVILFEWGKTEITITNDLQIVFNHHKRVKILDSDGFDEADIQIGYPGNGGVQRLKASTYNLVNGKIVESEVTKDMIFKETESKSSGSVKFSFPDVKEGSILEYSYNVKANSLTRLKTWYFQTSIPVIFSEYYVTIPNWFTYKELMTGYESLALTEVNRKSIRVGQQNVVAEEHHYIAKDLPAFKNEPYMTARTNFISKIDFELERIDIPGSMYEEVLGSYASINKDFLDDVDFGKRVKISKNYTEMAETISDDKEGLEKARAIYDYVKKEINWNKEIRLFADESFKTILEDKEGSSADINLFLTTLLVNAGFTAHPAIYSTRANGILHPIYAIISRFNDVISCLEFDGKVYLLDATDENLPFNMLSFRSLNGQALLITPNGSRWTDLKGNETDNLSINGAMTLNEEGGLTGNIGFTRKGYEALELRDEIKNEGKEKYLENLKENQTDWEISSIEFLNLEDLSKPVNEKIEIEIENGAESLGNIIYLNPIIADPIDDNPFKLEERKFPVDFGCSQSQAWMFQIKIPEGFQVDEIPEAKAMALPGNAGLFQYQVTEMGQTIQVVSRFVIKKSIFLPDEYPLLQEFFTQIADKHSESVVLKRITE